MRKIILALAAVAVVAVVYAALGGGIGSGTGDAVGIPDKSAANSAASGDRDHADPGLRPQPGTYVYKGSGTESVDVLTGSRHVFPKHVPVEVILEEGCNWSMKISLVSQNVTDEHICTNSDGVLETGYETSIEFFDISQNDTWKCPASEAPFRARANAAAGDSWSWVCAAEDSDFSRTARMLGEQTLSVAGTSVPTTHVRIDGELSGAKQGSSTYEYWLAGNGLPVRWKAQRDYDTDTSLGHTGYVQHLDYRITSLTPR